MISWLIFNEIAVIFNRNCGYLLTQSWLKNNIFAAVYDGEVYVFAAKKMTVFQVFYFNVFAAKNLVFAYKIAGNLLYLAAKLLFF